MIRTMMDMCMSSISDIFSVFQDNIRESNCLTAMVSLVTMRVLLNKIRIRWQLSTLQSQRFQIYNVISTNCYRCPARVNVFYENSILFLISTRLRKQRYLQHFFPHRIRSIHSFAQNEFVEMIDTPLVSELRCIRFHANGKWVIADTQT